MSFSYSESEFRDLLEEISRRNLEIQKLNLPHKLWDARLEKCSCHFGNNMDEVSDSGHAPLPSAHMKMEDIAMKAQRDALILSLHEHLMKMNCMHEGHSRVVMGFGLTEAGSAAITISLDSLSVHERPVTPKTLAPKLRDLAQRLSRNKETVETSGPVRRFVISYTDRIAAVSPSQAIWKWLCLRHPREAMALLSTKAGSSLEIHASLERILKSTAVHEVFEPGPSLASALEVECPRLVESLHHHGW